MGTVNVGLFTSTTDEWPTPPDLFATLDAEFAFTLDPCASVDNATCERFYTKHDDGLTQPWAGRVYMNPPYGRQIGLWVRKAYEAAQAGATVACLIPARTDTAYWHEYVMRSAEVRFIRGRLNFDCERQQDRKASGASKAHNAPFPSVVVIFRPGRHVPAMTAIERNGIRIAAPLEGVA